MIGTAKELRKGMTVQLGDDFTGPWRMILEARKGRVAISLTLRGGEKLTLDNDQGVRFDPSPTRSGAKR